MYISQVDLTNFRGYEHVTLPLSPLTVLLGPNSAGKSCFGHAICGLTQAHRANKSPPSLTPPSLDVPRDVWPIDLGGLDEMRRRGAIGPVSIQVRVVDNPDVAYDWAYDFGGPAFEQRLEVTGVRTRQVAQAIAESMVTEPSDSPVETFAKTRALAVNDQWETKFGRDVESPWYDDKKTDLTERTVNLGFRGVAIDRAYHLTGTEVPVPIKGIEALAKALQSTGYLSPSRLRPERTYRRPRAAPTSVGPDGEYTPEYLWTHREASVQLLEPPKIPRTREEVRLNAAWKKHEFQLPGAVNWWLSHFSLATRAATQLVDGDRSMRLDVSMIGDETLRALTDVGFGVSQILPVLVAGCHMKRDSLLIVELPEAHLHPRAQAALADFFCSIVMAGGRLLVETHSEALFHRLRLWSALNASLEAAISVWLVDAPRDGKCAQPVRLTLGDELKWPEGFLSEGSDIELSIALARQASLRR